MVLVIFIQPRVKRLSTGRRRAAGRAAAIPPRREIVPRGYEKRVTLARRDLYSDKVGT